MPTFVKAAFLKTMADADTVRDVVISPTADGEEFQLIAVVGSQHYTLRAANGPTDTPRRFRNLEAAAKCVAVELRLTRAQLRLEGWKPKIKNTKIRRPAVGMEAVR